MIFIDRILIIIRLIVLRSQITIFLYIELHVTSNIILNIWFLWCLLRRQLIANAFNYLKFCAHPSAFVFLLYILLRFVKYKLALFIFILNIIVTTVSTFFLFIILLGVLFVNFIILVDRILVILNFLLLNGCISGIVVRIWLLQLVILLHFLVLKLFLGSIWILIVYTCVSSLIPNITIWTINNLLLLIFLIYVFHINIHVVKVYLLKYI